MTILSKILHKRITSAVIAVLVGLVVASVVLAAAGYDPVASFAALIEGSLGKPKYISNVFIKATPILLTGVGVAFAYKVGLFNIGAEGQYVVGTVCAFLAGYLLNLPAVIEIPLVILAAILGGGAVGALIGWLKARFGINEVITSIMLNWISLYLNNFVVSLEVFHRPNSTGTYFINDAARTMILPDWKLSEEGIAALSNIPWLQEVMLRTDVNAGFLVAVTVAILASVILTRTKIGYQMRAVGLNADGARFAGISVNRSIILSMFLSGAFCGLAGAFTVTGVSPHGIATLAAFENYGFNGLSVAFIASTSPLGCIPASLLFSILIYGGQTVQQVLSAPSEIINIMIGVIVFFMALAGIIPKLADRIDARELAKKEQEQKEAEHAV